MKYLILLIIGFSSVGYSQQSERIEVQERALIAVVNMAAGREKPNSIRTNMYEREERHAIQMIEARTKDYYGKVVLLFREETNEPHFLETLKELAADNKIKAIDMIIYVHGHNADYSEKAPALGLYHSENKFSLTSELSYQVRQVAQNKLRMLYSDACWGVTHNQDWLNAGFIAVAGAQKVDGNHSVDLKRFFKKWVTGEKFGEAIRFANGNIVGKMMDWVISADSTKVPVGDLDLTIDSTLNESALEE